MMSIHSAGPLNQGFREGFSSPLFVSFLHMNTHFIIIFIYFIIIRLTTQ